MGQHKHNPVAIQASKGEIPTKPKKIGKRERDSLIYAKCKEVLIDKVFNANVAEVSQKVEG